MLARRLLYGLICRPWHGLAPALLALPALMLLAAAPALAQDFALPAFSSTPTPGGGQTYTLSVQTLLTLTALSFLPTVLLLMTSFTRIVIVLSMLRYALGMQSTPSNQVLIGLALFLTLFVMSPVLDRIYAEAYRPFSENKIAFTEALEKGSVPLHGFMLRQTRETDLALFARISNQPALQDPAQTPCRGSGVDVSQQRLQDLDFACPVHGCPLSRPTASLGAAGSLLQSA